MKLIEISLEGEKGNAYAEREVPDQLALWLMELAKDLRDSGEYWAPEIFVKIKGDDDEY